MLTKKQKDDEKVTIWTKIKKYFSRLFGGKYTMKLTLHNGACSGRWICLNINKEYCHVHPKNKKWFVECNYYVKNMFQLDKT